VDRCDLAVEMLGQGQPIDIADGNEPQSLLGAEVTGRTRECPNGRHSSRNEQLQPEHSVFVVDCFATAIDHHTRRRELDSTAVRYRSAVIERHWETRLPSATETPSVVIRISGCGRDAVASYGVR
jgi:hypothetical protein